MIGKVGNVATDKCRLDRKYEPLMVRNLRGRGEKGDNNWVASLVSLPACWHLMPGDDNTLLCSHGGNLVNSFRILVHTPPTLGNSDHYVGTHYYYNLWMQCSVINWMRSIYNMYIIEGAKEYKSGPWKTTGLWRKTKLRPLYWTVYCVHIIWIKDLVSL